MLEDRWLSERLGRAAWTVEQQDSIEELRSADAGFWQAKVPTPELTRVAELEEVGFRVVDVNVTFRREPAAGAGVNVGVREARESDRAAVLQIAQYEYTVSRFHLDPRIPDAVAGAIKRDWVDNYFRGERGDRMLVFEGKSGVIGFELVLEQPHAAIIDLIAVAATQRRAGAGAALVSRLIASTDLPVQVGTQVSNVAALGFYERLGFTVERTQYVLHRHSP